MPEISWCMAKGCYRDRGNTASTTLRPGAGKWLLEGHHRTLKNRQHTRPNKALIWIKKAAEGRGNGFFNGQKIPVF
ncbi:hypothetical protein [Pseudomonas sp. Irchel 3E20]|uniref:hypothetical protein n=1 Tax=Pseudomonas sp. Irchel 3E20 TaxID=2008983 RepID=UPI00113FD29C|nr:hypothetical protein [Pseudomonas sp. Irchel 3E20]